MTIDTPPRLAPHRTVWKWLYGVLAIAILAFVLVIIYAPPRVDMATFTWTKAAQTHDWAIQPPAQQGFQPEPLIALHNTVTHRKSKRVQSLLVARNNALVFEQYYPVRSAHDGTPMPKPFPPSADTPHQMRSITKTITATLLGTLLYQGKIAHTDTPLLDFYPHTEMADREQKQALTLNHALNFNSGLNWQEWYVANSDAMNMWLSDDPYAYVHSKTMAHPPGEPFVYQGAMSVLLGGAIEQVTQQSLRQYAQEALFSPLGITQFDWFTHEVTGDYLGSSGLYLRSRDLAKLGQLYLNRGVWQGQRIFSEEWAAQSLQPKGKFWPKKTIAYGHNWWFPQITQANGERIQIAAMRGAGGQEMMILPDYQLIMVMTSGAYIGQDEDYPFELLVDYILPAIGVENAKYQPRI
ncbi:serine hydrolase domain-containing protein [Photobacterium aphoticum]|uniref:Beta-lactamase-related domain-containing protein n=1 Tax=Photobacterium aphoticum TaxID=754436 RepID=A0A0J1JH30_9GAMM|nr:serine hydrolase [Photobacterium aphoticum]KLV01172.1 hypothetical protein ABT58_08520 [Photobacterium aphoticum]PSU56099.1 hypothetical protein C9I90_13910 [Photobacterium aphoticum]GHA49438.1 hypothetical protein GCM10007086_24030 [Photobacterium aphoticum]